MRILTVLTYYRPHTSGLTIYAERIAKAFVQRGHEVTVLTSQFDRTTPREEFIAGIKVIRLPVVTRLNKGVIMPTIGWAATQEVLKHDALLLHLPQFDAAGISLRGRLLKKPTIVAYHSDLLLPPGFFNRIVNGVVDLANLLTGVFTHRITAYTDDFASHSPFLRRFAHKRATVAPPVELHEPTDADVQEFQQTHNPENRRVIGMATRFASEKGVEVLLDAFSSVNLEFPESMVLFAGQYEGVWGEEGYFQRLIPRIRELQAKGSWKFLGVLPLEKMPAFYRNLDVICVPSLNSTETFGFVQIEAMMNGVPSIASALPGVRQPVAMTGMGKIVPIGDPTALAEALIEVLKSPADYSGDPEKIRKFFNPDTTASHYEDIFDQIQREIGA